jgi:hypothetical protein
MLGRFGWMRVYFSPFKFPVPKFYCGEIAVGVPYFFPRNWVKDPERSGYKIAVPKKIGFDFVGLGWKTKWEERDYRYEYSPIWSFVFFKWQIAVRFIAPEISRFWECWLYYHRNTKGTTKQRLERARKDFPCVWTSRSKGEKTKICYWDLILKRKYL